MGSDLYHWLNALAGKVPNGDSANPAMEDVDYTATGVYAFLPDTLKAAISEKWAEMGTRFSADGLLDNDTGKSWVSLGKLWVPSEVEVFGSSVWGTAGYSYVLLF